MPCAGGTVHKEHSILFSYFLVSQAHYITCRTPDNFHVYVIIHNTTCMLLHIVEGSEINRSNCSIVNNSKRILTSSSLEQFTRYETRRITDNVPWDDECRIIFRGTMGRKKNTYLHNGVS